MNVSFIGLGKLGMPCAEAAAQKGHCINGYDKIKKHSKHITLWPNIQGAVSGAEIVFISVATPHQSEYDGSLPITHLPAKDFNYTQLKEAVIECNKHMNRNQRLVVISTVLPGVMREQISPLVTNTNLSYNPYLIAMGTVANDMLNPEMIMIGTENGEPDVLLEEFYQSITENDCSIVTGTWDECECIKVFYNTFISTKLGIVNMIQDVAVKKGNINVDVVTDALANSTKRIMSNAYMKAGMGDGGPCHPRDNIALRKLSEDLNLGYDLFGGIALAREKQAENMAVHILRYGNKIKFSSNSYKSNTDLTDGSYSLLVQYYVKKHGGWIVDENPSVYVLVHPDDPPIEKAYNFNPWLDYGNNK